MWTEIAIVLYFIVGIQFILIYRNNPEQVDRVEHNEKLFYTVVLIFWLPVVIFLQVRKWWRG